VRLGFLLATCAVLGGACGSPDLGSDAGRDAPVASDGGDVGCPAFPGACPVEGERSCFDEYLWTCTGGCWRMGMSLCGRPELDAGSAIDASDRLDAPSEPPDAGGDAPSAPVDAGTDAPTTPDAGVPATMTYCVDIDVSNTCEMSVSPTEITIPADQIAYFCWRNRSADYPVDVWLSYGGGYTDLAPGATWNEPPGHCLGPTAHDEYADVSTACSDFRFLIHCL
jgi:hypothetical protein